MARPPKYTAAQIMKIQDLLSVGLSEREVAAQLSVPKSTVHFLRDVNSKERE